MFKYYNDKITVKNMIHDCECDNILTKQALSNYLHTEL